MEELSRHVRWRDAAFHQNPGCQKNKPDVRCGGRVLFPFLSEAPSLAPGSVVQDVVQDVVQEMVQDVVTSRRMEELSRHVRWRNVAFYQHTGC